MKISSVQFVGGLSAFYFDDQKAIGQGASQDGFVYLGQSATQGFKSVRTAGESISILLELEDGSLAIGDCCAVQYSGAGGRDPLFLADDYIPLLERELRPQIEGMDVRNFRKSATFIDNLQIAGKQLHTAIRYGLSQALLDAAALAQRIQKTEVICNEYGLPLIPESVPLFGQSGDDRYKAVDKMIMKGVDVLPHGLINNIPDKLGYQGEKLADYIRWIRNRIDLLQETKRTQDQPPYQPKLHIDVYGTVGRLFDGNIDKTSDYLASLQEQAGHLELYIEGPIDAGGRDQQIEALGALTRRLGAIGSPVKIVADEWCNTYQDIVDFTDAQCCHMVQIKTPDLGSVHNIVEAVLYCHEKGMEAYQGGTCNETDISARTCVQIALACRPQRLLVKPGMGFDEGMSIVTNEMNRTLAALVRKQKSSPINQHLKQVAHEFA